MDNKELTKYLKNILVIYKNDECECTDLVINILSKLKLKAKIKIRDKIIDSDFKDNKLIISIGGDGTALKVAQHITNSSLLLVVKNNSILSEGFISRTNMDSFEKKFESIVTGKFKVRKLPRIEASINGKKVNTFAINEVSLTRKKPYQTMMYDLNGNIERATGIIVSTPLGSTAWNLSSGGKKMNINDKKLQFVIREPYRGKIYKVFKKQGFLKNNEEFSVKSITSGVIAFDSTQNDYTFGSDSIIKIKKSNSYINFIEF